MSKEYLFSKIDAQKDQMIEALIQLCSIPAIGPENGGEGELKKSLFLIDLLKNAGFEDIKKVDAPDSRVPSGIRPNILARTKKEFTRKRLWIVTHLDVVPPGDEPKWTVTKPFKPVLKDGKVYGRGTLDNGQSLVASIFALKAIQENRIKPNISASLAFVADEEQGSKMGIQYLLNKGFFKKEDLIIVPDSGNPQGSFIEVAEKSILWFKITTKGKQTHGSLPNKGLNAHRIGMRTALEIDEFLHKKYDSKNEYFDVPVSTFEPTKKEGNVDAVNIIPGDDAIYFDCRILPQYDLMEILNDIEGIINKQADVSGTKIGLEILQKQTAPNQIDNEAEITRLLKQAIKDTREIEATIGGIGGGTCAAYFRKKGIPAAVWSTIDETAHQPDEYAIVDNMISDAKVFAELISLI